MPSIKSRPALSARTVIGLSSPHVGAWHRAGPAERYCSPSRSCARCVTSSASGRTYAAHSVDCSTDAAAVQPTASRWCDNLEREPEREPECGPSHVPLPQPDSWSRTRSWRCRRWRLPKRRSPRRIRKSSGRRGGRAGAEAEEGDVSRAARAWRRWVCGGRERTREWLCAFASLLAVCAVPVKPCDQVSQVQPVQCFHALILL